MATSLSGESFRGLLLRHRGRTGLTQSQLAARSAAARRTLQDWESGVNYPTAESLQRLITAVLEAGGLSAGQEAQEAESLWAAVESEAPRMHAPFDSAWFARVLSDRVSPPPASDFARESSLAVVAPMPEHRLDWGDAPDTAGFVGRTHDCLQTIRAHDGAALCVALGANGEMLISGGFDHEIKLWHAPSGRLVNTLSGHVGAVWSVALSADPRSAGQGGQLLASASFDGTVRLWDVPSAACVRTLQGERPFERTDISGLSGITEANREALVALGAVDKVPTGLRR